MLKSLLKPFSDFDSNIAKDISRGLGKKELKEIKDSLANQYLNWNNLFRKEAYKQASISRKISKGLDSLSLKELNDLDKRRKKIIEVKLSFKKAREGVKNQIGKIVKEDSIAIRGFVDLNYSKTKLLTDKNAGIGVLKSQMRYMKKHLNALHNEPDELVRLGNETKIKIIKVIYQKYLLALNNYEGSREFTEEVESNADLYKELIEYMSDNSLEKYPLLYYATPNVIELV